MIVQGERVLLLATPIVAMAAVALGLRVGAGGRVRAAVVYGAPESDAGTGLAWQVVAFDEDHGTREPVALAEIDVTARAGGREARWVGSTNEDGAAEMLLPMPSAQALSLDVRAGGELLAGGGASVPATIARSAPASAWARFARREGAIALDVAVLGQRVASGFPASIWVRATDAVTRAPLGNATIEPEGDASLSPATAAAHTDTRGWAHVVATPTGYGVALMLHARATREKTGDWAGALLVSPGAAQLVARDRYLPDEEPTIDVVVPNVRTSAYMEIDDARGRAWAASVWLVTSQGEAPHARVRVPRLAPGLYWAVASSDPAAGALLGPGTIVRPFFVAASDEAALALGTDKDECAPPRDPREFPRVLKVCLALAGATPVPRWTALEGFSAQHARNARRRSCGLAIALGAIAIAMFLETILLLRAAHAARMRLREATSEEREALGAGVGRAGNVGIALFVALLGLALLGAFLERAG
jgi:hypothetical protein